MEEDVGEILQNILEDVENQENIYELDYFSDDSISFQDEDELEDTVNIPEEEAEAEEQDHNELRERRARNYEDEELDDVVLDHNFLRYIRPAYRRPVLGSVLQSLNQHTIRAPAPAEMDELTICAGFVNDALQNRRRHVLGRVSGHVSEEEYQKSYEACLKACKKNENCTQQALERIKTMKTAEACVYLLQYIGPGYRLCPPYHVLEFWVFIKYWVLLMNCDDLRPVKDKVEEEINQAVANHEPNEMLTIIHLRCIMSNIVDFLVDKSIVEDSEDPAPSSEFIALDNVLFQLQDIMRLLEVADLMDVATMLKKEYMEAMNKKISIANILVLIQNISDLIGIRIEEHVDYVIIQA